MISNQEIATILGRILSVATILVATIEVATNTKKYPKYLGTVNPLSFGLLFSEFSIKRHGFLDYIARIFSKTRKKKLFWELNKLR